MIDKIGGECGTAIININISINQKELTTLLYSAYDGAGKTSKMGWCASEPYKTYHPSPVWMRSRVTYIPATPAATL